MLVWEMLERGTCRKYHKCWRVATAGQIATGGRIRGAGEIRGEGEIATAGQIASAGEISTAGQIGMLEKVEGTRIRDCNLADGTSKARLEELCPRRHSFRL
jgi:hypothetical protein